MPKIHLQSSSGAFALAGTDLELGTINSVAIRQVLDNGAYYVKYFMINFELKAFFFIICSYIFS